MREFEFARTHAIAHCFEGGARTIELARAMAEESPWFEGRKIRGIVSSPPYLGLIDYHEQHAYAYELFDLKRKDSDEIGPLSKGQGKAAKKAYVESVTQALKNCETILVDNYDIFLVANDKHNLYTEIAEKAGMEIIEEETRPVLRRAEWWRRSLYKESFFHLKKISG